MHRLGLLDEVAKGAALAEIYKRIGSISSGLVNRPLLHAESVKVSEDDCHLETMLSEIKNSSEDGLKASLDERQVGRIVTYYI